MSDSDDDDPTPAAMTARERFVALARSYDGKSAEDPEYLQLIAPLEIPARQREMATESSCGLVVLGLWRMMGVDHELLARSYVDGKALEWVLKVATDKKAVRTAPFSLADGTVRPGDSLMVDGFAPDAHVYSVVAVGDAVTTAHDVGRALLSIDGGQRVGGREGILLVKRTVRLVLGNVTDVRESPPPTTARRLTHAFDLDALLA